jgi:WD40 repeat protein
MNEDGSSRRLLSGDCFPDLIWSPDGRHGIAFAAVVSDERGRAHYRIFDVESGAVEDECFLPPNSYGIRWAPDGKGVTFLDRDARDLHRRALNDTTVTPVTRFSSGRITGYRWSQGGRFLFCKRFVDGRVALWRTGSDPGNPIQITDFASGAVDDWAVSEDASLIAFTHGQDQDEIVLIRDSRWLYRHPPRCPFASSLKSEMRCCRQCPEDDEPLHGLLEC